MAVELARAYITVIPEIKGVQSAVSKSMSGFGRNMAREMGVPMASVGQQTGRTLGEKLKLGAKIAVGSGMASVGTLAGTALAKGFGRLKTLDEAEGKLRGLGHSANGVEKIMGNALGAVKGTAFGMGEAATTAAGAVAAGIKPGEALEKNLTLVADAATIAGTDMGSMGAIFNKVASTNKVQGDVLQQLGQQGIPVLQFLSKEMGVSAEEVTKLASEGKVDFETFSAAMEAGLGGAAQASGDTFTGAMKNVGAALGRLGANFLQSSFSQFTGFLGTAISGLDLLAPAAERAGNTVGRAMQGSVEAISNFAKSDAAAKAWEALGRVLSSVWDSIQKMLPSLQSLGRALGALIGDTIRSMMPYLKVFAAVLGVALVAAFKILSPVVRVVANALGWVLGALRPLTPIIGAAAAAWLIYAGVTKGVAIAQGLVKAAALGTRIGLAALSIQTWASAVAAKAMAVAQGIAGAATTGWAGATKLLNSAWAASPIGVIVVGILLLVGAIVLAYKKSETFRRVVDAAWAGIKSAIGAVVDWFRNTAWPSMSAVLSWIGEKASALGGFFVKAGRTIGRAMASIGRVLLIPFRAAAIFWEIVIRSLIWLVKWTVGKIKGYWQKLTGYLSKPVGKAVDWVKKKIDQMRVGFTILRDRIRKLWSKIYEFVARPIRRAVDWVKKKIDQMRVGFRILRDRIRKLWSKMYAFISAPIRRAVDWVKNKIDEIRKRFLHIRNKTRILWARMRNYIQQPIRAGIDWAKKKADEIRRKFLDVRDKIGRGWAKLKRRLQSPIHAAIKWINTTLIGGKDGKSGGINSMLKTIGVKSSTFRVSKIPNSWHTGGYTGPGPKMKPAGLVHADEFVLKKEATNRLRRKIGLAGLNYMNATGNLPGMGFARGGYVYPSMVKWVNKNLPSAVITSTKRNWGGTSNHEVGRAVDIGGSAAVMREAARAIKTTFGSKILELIHNPGFSVKNGRSVPSSFWGSGTWAAHRDHVHWAMQSMSGGFGGWVGGLFDSAKAALDDLTGKFSGLLKNIPGSGMIPPMVKGIGGKMLDGLKKSNPLSNALSDLFDFVGDTYSDLKDSATVGKNLVLGRTMAARRGWTGGQWSALKTLWNKESNWDHKARNPSSGAYGIPQALPASKMASAGSNWRNSAMTQIKWGLNYIAGRYGNPAAALRFHRRNNWYSDGGLVKALEFDSGGWLPTGVSAVVNNTGKPEPLRRADLDRGTVAPEINVRVFIGNEPITDIVRTEIEVVDEFENAIQRMGG